MANARPAVFVEGGLGVPYDIRYRLEELRKLRSEQRRHAQIAEDAMGRATVAMSTKRATNVGGTGDFPLTQYGPVYSKHRELSIEAGKKAEAIWMDVRRYVDALGVFDTRMVVTGYYQNADSFERVACMVKRSRESVDRLHRNALKSMEKM